jgi:hypothetical protein
MTRQGADSAQSAGKRGFVRDQRLFLNLSARVALVVPRRKRQIRAYVGRSAVWGRVNASTRQRVNADCQGTLVGHTRQRGLPGDAGTRQRVNASTRQRVNADCQGTLVGHTRQRVNADCQGTLVGARGLPGDAGRCTRNGRGRVNANCQGTLVGAAWEPPRQRRWRRARGLCPPRRVGAS